MVNHVSNTKKMKNNNNTFSHINTSNKHFLPEGSVSIMNYDLTSISENVTFSSKSNINNTSILQLAHTATKLIFDFFSPISAFCSKPKFTVTSNSIIIHVFYFIPSPNRSLNNNTVNNLGEVLSKLFGRNVELRMVRINYPYLDRHILAQYIAFNTQDYNFVQIIRRIFRTISPLVKVDSKSCDLLPNSMAAGIVGIKVRLAGRLVTERSKPRQTVQTAQIGTFSNTNMSMIDRSSFTSKNKKNSFTIKVWINNSATL